MKPAVLVFLCHAAAAGARLSAAAPAEVSFSRDIRPILSDTCFKCHGPDDKGRKSEFRLDDRDAALKGGKSGDPAIVPGRPGDSRLVTRLHSTDPDEVMPPPAMKKTLTPAQIQLVEKWIAAGAPYEKHWAFQAPIESSVPAPVDTTWPRRNEIDAFVQSSLVRVGLAPSAPAERSALLRRVSFDLIGLPPTPDELAAFLADASPGAYDRAVDRLLASPRYGERWGRKWLDLARYADTNGYEKDRGRTVWPYRDWVIKALNADQPFDQFTIEQIAGDLLPQATTDQLIATGFHRNTMLNEEGGIDPLEFRYHAMVDRVGTTSATWLGLTLQCAQCHTHKYDPVSQREYYSMMALLNNADEPELELPDAARNRQDAARADKADRLLAALADKWPVANEPVAWESPAPVAVIAAPAEPSRRLDDGSVLFTAPGPEKAAVTIDLPGIQAVATHLRIEALTDDSLAGTGPGRTAHGNFVLSELEARAGGEQLTLTQPSATAEQAGFPVAAAIDGREDTGWAVHDGRQDLHTPKSATFVFNRPVPAGTALTISIKQLHGSHHTIGRLRVSLGHAVEPPADLEASRRAALASAFEAWLANQRAHTAAWEVATPVEATSNLPLLTLQPDGSIFVSGDITKADTYRLRFTNVPAGLTAVRLEALPDERLPARGPGMTYYEGPKGDFFLGEFQLTSGGRPLKIASATESYAKNAFGQAGNAQVAIDGDPETGWSCSEGQGRAHEAVFTLESPLAPVGGELSLTMMFGRHFACSLGRFRLSFTTQSGDLAASAVASEVQPLLHRPAGDLTADDRARLQREFLLQAPELAAARQEIDALRRPTPALTALVMRERPPENPRPTFIHNRGEFTQPTDRVEPGVLSMLNPLPPGAPKNRLAFARWLVSRENPLTSRVVVNRAWAAFFGRGLVKTQEDFGYQGALPSHPELLDWLAVRFMTDGWSMKKLHRLIVTSHTYRQASAERAEAAAADPDNTWLWRGPRLRLEAEEVRDAALRASGLLSEKMFGPSVYPPQPPSVTTEGTYGALAWQASTGEDRYRRSVYTFAKRTAPFAFASTFDAPTGESCVIRRDQSNTPLQALTLLNDITITEAAQALGRRLASLPGTAPDKIADACRHCLSRAPGADEAQALQAFYETQRQFFATATESAAQVAGEGPADSVAERAAWTLLGRALLNLDEFVTKS